MQIPETNVAIIGAGPYGLSLGAHLHSMGVPHRIFGRPMQSWQQNMPAGMSLKSDGYASSLYDRKRSFTLEHYCAEKGLPYKRTGMPIPLETFVGYGLEFQKRLVPQLEQEDIAFVEKQGKRFLLRTVSGEEFFARRVVLAVGITHFGYMPAELQGLPESAVTHSYSHGEVSQFAGKRVLVVGAGASAVDLAASLADAHADVHIMGRRPKIGFYMPEMDPRPLKRRVLFPRSGLGVGWEYVICVETPLLFRALPEWFRHRVVRRHLGPIPGWFMRDKVENRIPMHMSARIQSVECKDDKVHVHFNQPDKTAQEFVADHVIAATGYKPNMQSLRFLDPALAAAVKTAEGTPVLGVNFQTSVSGLHMIGLASANCFGPAQRFAVGAKYTSWHLSRYLKLRSVGRRSQRPAPRASAEAQPASGV
ncbi:NAD(P)-binding domain-containing protein [Acidipila sp. EB88]|uniref:NAD(P)-binding domain-containing protein n=1 Tax=Acidipila sp. EB88 TaxID=2305226 RepID=UPI000F5FF61E|nr:NAD(P)-binding domain-containing protein [Acidipila sp. EB88]RRA47486.1 NAD(P)/FAD-dependent oxidoreductase [Acidipila sp. EB88]